MRQGLRNLKRVGAFLPAAVPHLLALLTALAALALQAFYLRTSARPTVSGQALFLAVALVSSVASLLPKRTPRLALLAFASASCLLAGERTLSGFGLLILSLAVLAGLVPLWALVKSDDGPDPRSLIAVVCGGLLGLAFELLLVVLA